MIRAIEAVVCGDVGVRAVTVDEEALNTHPVH
jgi:hypothetical protein